MVEQIKKKRCVNSPEYNRKYWHIHKNRKGKKTCECCNKEIDSVNWNKHIKTIRHRTLTDPEFKDQYEKDKLEKRQETLKKKLENVEGENKKKRLNKILEQTIEELKH